MVTMILSSLPVKQKGTFQSIQAPEVIKLVIAKSVPT
jgi:hypothetical protein